jgi:hypothetical protein
VNTPEASDHTRIKERIAPGFDLNKTADEEIIQQWLQRFNLPLKPLAQFDRNVASQEKNGILFNLNDCLQLLLKNELILNYFWLGESILTIN